MIDFLREPVMELASHCCQPYVKSLVCALPQRPSRGHRCFGNGKPERCLCRARAGVSGAVLND